MKLFNTLTQSLETLTPLDNTVRLYVCGVTPYDTTHLGHAFTYVSFDTLIRYLEYSGYTVKYVQNVTDIDDDVLRKARELGLPGMSWGGAKQNVSCVIWTPCMSVVPMFMHAQPMKFHALLILLASCLSVATLM